MLHNPGGDCHWAGGQPNVYPFILLVINPNEMISECENTVKTCRPLR